MDRRQPTILSVSVAVAICVLVTAVTATIIEVPAADMHPMCPDQVKQLSLAQKLHAPGHDEMGRPLDSRRSQETVVGP